MPSAVVKGSLTRDVRLQVFFRRPCPTSAAGDITKLSPSTFSYPWQLPTFMASLFLSPAINLSPGSLSPANNFSPVSLSPAIIVHRCQRHRWEIYCRYQWHWRSLKIRDKDYSPVSLTVHPQNVRFQNVRFQNVWFQNVWKARFTKRQVYKTSVYTTSGLQNVRSSKCLVAKKHPYIFCTCGWWKSAGSVAAMFAAKVKAVFYSLF